MVGGDHLYDEVPDVRLFVCVGCIHQLIQPGQELIHVERDGAADVDELVVGLPKAFFRHQLFFIQLLAGAKARVLDHDIHVGRIACLPDQVSCQRIDPDRASHVKDEDLPAFCVGACEHDQADGLRDRHEVADDVRMRDRNRAALLDLLLKDRDDGAVAAQYIAEPHSDEFRFDVFEDFARAVLVRVLISEMGEELRDPGRFSFLDLRVEALHDHLAQPFAGAHDVGRIDRLVR